MGRFASPSLGGPTRHGNPVCCRLSLFTFVYVAPFGLKLPSAPHCVEFFPVLPPLIFLSSFLCVETAVPFPLWVPIWAHLSYEGKSEVDLGIGFFAQ